MIVWDSSCSLLGESCLTYPTTTGSWLVRWSCFSDWKQIVLFARIQIRLILAITLQIPLRLWRLFISLLPISSQVLLLASGQATLWVTFTSHSAARHLSGTQDDVIWSYFIVLCVCVHACACLCTHASLSIRQVCAIGIYSSLFCVQLVIVCKCFLPYVCLLAFGKLVYAWVVIQMCE